MMSSCLPPLDSTRHGLHGVPTHPGNRHSHRLGARPGQIAAEILRSGGILAGAGARAGIALAAAVPNDEHASYGVRPSDIATYLSATGVLIAVTLVACLIPTGARRPLMPRLPFASSSAARELRGVSGLYDECVQIHKNVTRRGVLLAGGSHFDDRDLPR